MAIFNTVFMVKNWAQSCYVTGLKKCYIRIKRPYDSGFITDSKISTLDSRLKQLRIRMRIQRIRVDGSRTRNEKLKLRIQKHPDT